MAGEAFARIVYIVVGGTILFSMEYIGNHGGHWLFPVCDSPDCFDFIAELRASMNLGTSPCDNLYAYVCSNWQSNFPKEANQLQLLQGRVTRALLRAIDEYPTESNPTVSNPVTSAVTSFRYCVRIWQNQTDNTASLRNFFKDVNLTMNTLLTGKNPVEDFNRMLLSLALTWGISPLVSITPFATTTSNLSQGVAVTFANSLLYKWFLGRVSSDVSAFELMSSYALIVETVFDQLDHTKQATIAHSLVQIDVTLLAVVASAVVRASSETPTGVQLKLSDMGKLTKDIISTEAWTSAFQDLLPFNVTTDTLMVYHEISGLYIYISALNVFAKQIDQLALFVMALIARNFAPLYSFSLVDGFLLGQYTRDRAVKTCLNILEDTMGYAMSHLFTKTFLNDTRLQQAETIVSKIRNATRILTENNPPSMERSWKKDKVMLLHQIIGRPSFLQSMDDLSVYYAHLPLPSEPYLDYILNSIRAELVRVKTIIYNTTPSEYSKERLEIYSMLAVNAYYSPQQNTIVIPPAILFSPFFHQIGVTFPAAVSYAALGHIVGHEVSHALDPLSNRHLFGEIHNLLSTEQDQQHLRCLKKVYNVYNSSAHVANHVGDLAFSENFADFGGLQSAYKAFKEYQKTANQSYNMDEIGFLHQFTQDQLFFIGHCFKWCGHSFSSSNIYADLELRCNVPAMNSYAFSNAFRCRQNSFMDPKEKCFIGESIY